MITDTLESLKETGGFRSVTRFMFPTNRPGFSVVATFDSDYIELFMSICRQLGLSATEVAHQIRDMIHERRCLSIRITNRSEDEVWAEIEKRDTGQ